MAAPDLPTGGLPTASLPTADPAAPGFAPEIRARPMALYVHWPFCASKCPYCDFNSHVADSIDQDSWRRAYLTELDSWAPALAGRRLTSIFFGGGTPSLMDPDTAAAVIGRAREIWPDNPGADLEITLEANPNSAEAARFEALRAAGINRLSLGVQALDDSALAFLGRTHSAAEAQAAVTRAKAHFPRVNADMIYARPGQTITAWQEELARLMGEGLGHLSLYQLTIERGTPFFSAHRRGDFTLPSDDDQAGLYLATGEVLARAGLAAYEVSNYARADEQCRHNLTYWRYGDFLGIGPGAHGRLLLAGTALATENYRAPADWLAAVGRCGRGIKEETPLTAMVRAQEMVIMGLRLEVGITAADFRAVTGGDFTDYLDRAAMARLTQGGYLSRQRGRLKATPEGRLRLDSVIASLLGTARRGS
ncbi:MAG: coproporphyrinogen III oxidase [Alphaproteobacteria bacterium]|nr:MAG: coproporphyrinogen III oxidase [Alphaproteobacteria bacterium]